MERKSVLAKELLSIDVIRAISEICASSGRLKEYTIGKSCAGRDIKAVKLGNAKDYALIVAATHGSEHITTNILLGFMSELANALKKDLPICGFNAVRALFGKGVIFVPRINPDGCEISISGFKSGGALEAFAEKISGGDYRHYNANLRGVDINHNFNAGWNRLKRLETDSEITAPAPTRYGGSHPESEPEVVCICELCRNIRIRQLLSLHTQGEVIYWTYGNEKPKRSERMAQIMASSSGYALDVPSGLAVGGGLKDWFIEEFNRPAFTAELGMGENPLPISSAEEIYNRVKEMLMLFCIM